MVYSLGDHFLCLDSCYGGCLWLVEEIERIYKFKLLPHLTWKIGRLIFEKLIDKSKDC
jgi:hypothetical protein